VKKNKKKANKGSLPERLLLGLDFGAGAVENLEGRRDAGAHAAVQVRLRALDVVVEVVTERLLRSGRAGVST
jgi:hypothetical protein